MFFVADVNLGAALSLSTTRSRRGIVSLYPRRLYDSMCDFIEHVCDFMLQAEERMRRDILGTMCGHLWSCP